MSDKRRQQLLIDNDVQIDLVWQTVRFWLLCVISTGLFLCVGIALFGEERTAMAVVNELFFKYGPAAVASIIVMPLVLMDIFRHSNRFAGPIYRLRTVLRQLAEGERVAHIKFRDDDYWQEVAEDFNLVLDRLQGPEEAAPTKSEIEISELPTFPVIPVAQTESSDAAESSHTIVG